MVLKKVCCCMSLRTGTLVFLYIFLIGSIWSVLCMLTDFGNPVIKQFISENAPLFYMNFFLSILGGLVYLATIIFITNKTPSSSLLSTTIAFLILAVIYSIYAMISYQSNGTLRTFFENVVAENFKTHNLSVNLQSYKNEIDEGYAVLLQQLYFSMVVNLIFIFYSGLVFHSYNIEVKNSNGASSSRKNNDIEVNASAPPPYANHTVVQLKQ